MRSNTLPVGHINRDIQRAQAQTVVTGCADTSNDELELWLLFLPLHRKAMSKWFNTLKKSTD